MVFGRSKVLSLVLASATIPQTSNEGMGFKGMEKLEQIFRAEESARHTLTDAHSRAEALAKQAETDAASTLDQAKRDAEMRAAEIREHALTQAHSDVESIAAGAAAELENTVGAARKRMPQAVKAALEELVG